MNAPTPHHLLLSPPASQQPVVAAASNSEPLFLRLTPVVHNSQDDRLLYLTAFFLILLLVWASFAKVDKIVRAEGRIIAQGRAQIVQHLEGGIVTEILAREGQSVTAGQVLMRLSDVQANTSVQQGSTRLFALKAQQARLYAEADGLLKPSFDTALPLEISQEAQKVFRERMAQLQSEVAVLKQQKNQKDAEFEEARQRIQSVTSEMETTRKQSALMESLYKKGAASQLELLDAQGRTQRLTTNFNDITASLPRLQAGTNELSARMEEAKSKFRSQARTELALVSAEIAKMELASSGDSDRLARTEVRAPTSGFINRLQVNTIGGVVKPGDALMEITPSEGPVAIEARIRPDDRAALHVGLPTRIVIGAFDYAEFGALEGRLTEISADTLQDEHGLRYYRVLIQTEINKSPLAKQSILPGMTARADVVLGKRSILNYLVSPLSRFQNQAFTEPH